VDRVTDGNGHAGDQPGDRDPSTVANEPLLVQLPADPGRGSTLEPIPDLPAGRLPERLPAHLTARLAEPPGPDRSQQAYALVLAAVEWGLDDSEVLALAHQHQPSRSKYGPRLAREVVRALAKARPGHPHIGRPCDQASCPNQPSWMRGSTQPPSAPDRASSNGRQRRHARPAGTNQHDDGQRRVPSASPAAGGRSTVARAAPSRPGSPAGNGNHPTQPPPGSNGGSRDAAGDSGPPPAGGAAGDAGDRPRIQVNQRQQRDVRADALAALHAANDPPGLFVRGDAVTRVIGLRERPATQTLTKDALSSHLADAADWYRLDKDGPVDIPLPRAVLDDLSGLPPEAWPLPVLERLTPAPVLAPDGTITTTPGYHPAARVYYAPTRTLGLPPVANTPSAREVEVARALLLEDLLGDFPFAGPEDGAAERAHAAALLLLPFARALIDGPTPLHLVEAPEQGTGKTLLVTACLLPYLGQEPAATAEARDDDEWRKRITAKLDAGAEVVFIDNLHRPLDAGALAAALTARWWSDRLLGASRTITLPVRCVWVATGNNPALSGELARRTVRIRIDARTDQPWLREGFRHDDLRGWATSSRADLVWAALTLIRAWVAAGRPAGTVRLGSYEAWAHVMSGILTVAGIDGFLGNLEELYATSDRDGAAWRALVGLWWARHGTSAVKVADLYELVAANDLPLPLRGDGDRSRRIQLGKLLARHRDRTIAGYHLHHAGASQGTARWQLIPATPGAPAE
jgi:hypothetical protein